MAEEKAKRLKWNQHPIDDDIKFKGPLSYRHFKIIGWTLFVGKLVVPLLLLATNASPAAAEKLAAPLGVLEFLTPLAVFFLLIANFSQLLSRGDYKRELLVNGGAALAIIAIFELLYHRYLVGILDAFVGDHFLSLEICNHLFSVANPAGFMAFNVFLDLFLCSVVLFFLNYEPKKFFTGSKRIIFRCCAILPVIYEIVCIWLKIQANSGDFDMPISFFPLLTTKPPMMFIVFCVMVAYFMLHEKRFCKAGRTHEEYEAYLETNRDSFHFAKFSALLCLVAGIIDFIVIISAILGDASMASGAMSGMSDSAQGAFLEGLMHKYSNAGFGAAADLIIFAPIMLLFNYKKSYKNTRVELAIPIVAIVALIFIYMEAILFAAGIAGKMFNEQVMPELEPTLMALAEGGDEELDLDALFAVLDGEDPSAADPGSSDPESSASANANAGNENSASANAENANSGKSNSSNSSNSNAGNAETENPTDES